MSDLFDTLAKLQATSKQLKQQQGVAVQSQQLALVIDLVVKALPEVTEGADTE